MWFVVNEVFDVSILRMMRARKTRRKKMRKRKKKMKEKIKN